MSNEPNITILGKIHRNELQITNRHKPVLDKLKAMGYLHQRELIVSKNLRLNKNIVKRV